MLIKSGETRANSQLCYETYEASLEHVIVARCAKQNTIFVELAAVIEPHMNDRTAALNHSVHIAQNDASSYDNRNRAQ